MNEYKAVGLQNGIIKAVTSCGDDKAYALKMAAYYRSIGYSGRCVTEAEFFEMQEKEAAEMRRYRYGAEGSA